MRHIPGVSLHWPAETKKQLLAMPGQAKVDAWRATHTKVNGWRDIGYHYVVHRDKNGIPQVYEGRSDALAGAHSGTNAGNQYLGINVAYGMDETVPDAMFILLAQLIADLSKKYGFPINRQTVRGHREFLPTQCPGNPLYSRINELIERANQLKSNKIPVRQFSPEPPKEEQLNTATVQFKDGTKIPAVLINNQAFVHVSEIGEVLKWDGETKTVHMK